MTRMVLNACRDELLVGSRAYSQGLRIKKRDLDGGF